MTSSEVLALLLASTQPEGVRWRNGAPYHPSNFLPENQLFTIVIWPFSNRIRPVQRCVLDVTPSAPSECTPHLLLFPIWGQHIEFSIHSLLSCASYMFTISSSVFLSTWPKHLSLASLIFSLMFATHHLDLISSFPIFSIFFIPIIHLNILILVQDH